MKHILLLSLISLIAACSSVDVKETSAPPSQGSQMEEHQHEIGQVCPGCGGKHFKVTYEDGRPSEIQCSASYCGIRFKTTDGGATFKGQGDYAKDMVIKDAKIPPQK